MGSFATVLARVVDAAADARGWHPFGLADPAGFAAMACDELLVHTSDAARGLEPPFTPAAELSAATLRRLFPWAPADADPWPAPLWANGRIDLPGLERQTPWRWHCAPAGGVGRHQSPRPPLSQLGPATTRQRRTGDHAPLRPATPRQRAEGRGGGLEGSSRRATCATSSI